MKFLNVFLQGDISPDLEGFLSRQINNIVKAYNISNGPENQVNVAVITEKPVEYHEPPF